MSQPVCFQTSPRRVFWLSLAWLILLGILSLSCSVGQLLVGRSRVAVPTATKTPRPTFTPLANTPTPLITAELIVRGVLPPGVTPELPWTVLPVAPVAQAVVSGSISVTLFATNTPVPTPTPAPTDTPAPPPTPTPDLETNRPTSEVGPRAVPTPYIVITTAKATGRRGPGTTFEPLGQVAQGDELMLLGRTPDNNWWQVCCIANQPAWVYGQLASPRGPWEQVPVLTPPPTPIPTSAPLPTDTPGPTSTPLPPFDIARGPEFPIQRDNGILTIWVKVYEGRVPYEKPLAGYVLKVFRDGVDVSSNEQSFGDAPFNNTKPEGNFEYNLKFEMFNAGEADWRIYLAKPDGYRVSPVTEFTTKGDAYRNLVVYIAYWLAR